LPLGGKEGLITPRDLTAGRESWFIPNEYRY